MAIQPTAPVRARADQDILSDVLHVFNTYPPLKHDRHYIEITVEAGQVNVVGNVRTPQAREIFMQRASVIPGVKAVVADELYDDETLRLQCAANTPYSVVTRVRYGVLMLQGSPPSTKRDYNRMIKKMEKTPGIREVRQQFSE